MAVSDIWSIIALFFALASTLMSLLVLVFTVWATVKVPREEKSKRRVLDAIWMTALAAAVSRGLDFIGVEGDAALAMWRFTITCFMVVCLMVVNHMTDLGPAFIESIREAAKRCLKRFRQ